MMGRFSASLYVGKMTDSSPSPAAAGAGLAARFFGGAGERAMAAPGAPVCLLPPGLLRCCA